MNELQYIRYIVVWLIQLVKALAALTHVRSCVQEVQVRSPEQTSVTLASSGVCNMSSNVCSWVTTT